MGATEEQMALLSGAGVTHVSYILILYSIAFLLFLFVNMLLQLYATHAWPIDRPPAVKPGKEPARANGHLQRRVTDAEEFELDGLMSEDDDDRYPSPLIGRKETQRVE